MYFTVESICDATAACHGILMGGPFKETYCFCWTMLLIWILMCYILWIKFVYRFRFWQNLWRGLVDGFWLRIRWRNSSWRNSIEQIRKFCIWSSNSDSEQSEPPRNSWFQFNRDWPTKIQHWQPWPSTKQPKTKNLSSKRGGHCSLQTPICSGWTQAQGYLLQKSLEYKQ